MSGLIDFEFFCIQNENSYDINKVLMDIKNYSVSVLTQFNKDDFSKLAKIGFEFAGEKKKLGDSEYETVDQFIGDLYLICRNAILFNGKNSMFGYIAIDIRKWIDDQLREKPKSQEDEWQKRLDGVVSRLHLHIANAPFSLSPWQDSREMVK